MTHPLKKPLKKQIITDEQMNPVAVIIDYQDWQKIESLLSTDEEEENPEPRDQAQILMQFAGKMNLTVDPLDYQRSERDSWL